MTCNYQISIPCNTWGILIQLFLTLYNNCSKINHYNNIQVNKQQNRMSCPPRAIHRKQEYVRPRTPWLDQGVVTVTPWLDQCTYLAQQRKNKCWDSLMGLHVYKMEAMEGYTHNMQARGAHDVQEYVTYLRLYSAISLFSAVPAIISTSELCFTDLHTVTTLIR